MRGQFGILIIQMPLLNRKEKKTTFGPSYQHLEFWKIESLRNPDSTELCNQGLMCDHHISAWTGCKSTACYVLITLP